MLAMLSGASNPFGRVSAPSSPKPHRKVSSPHSGKILELSREDVKNIRDLWNKIPRKQAVVERVFLRLFKMEPETIAPLFNLANLSETEILKSTRFHAHVMLFEQFLGKCIQLLWDEREDSFIDTIRSVGIRHLKIKGTTFFSSFFSLISILPF